MYVPFGRKKKGKRAEYNRYLFWIMIALELFMSFSFLGYVHIEPMSLTFVYIPVMVTGCILGPKESALVGTIFGAASMWKASAYYVGVGDALFSPARSGRPLESVLLSIGSRALFGFVMGLLYGRAKKSRHPMAWILGVSTLGRTIHSFLVYVFMGFLFPESGYGIADTFADMMRWDYLLFVLIADGILLLCYLFRNSAYFTRFFERIQTVDRLNAMMANHKKKLSVMLAAVLFASFSVALYFTNRLDSVMNRHGLRLSEEVSYDMMHLQIQFLLGMISLAILTIIAILLYQKNFSYLYYEARLDGLTGLFGRQQFFQIGEELLANMDFAEKEKTGCFVIIDVDQFKEINDCYGHPAGDKILTMVAESLTEAFGNHGIIGRLGGDEFLALVNAPMPREEIEAHLEKLKDGIARIKLPDGNVTCSIGVIPVEEGYTDELYRSADRLLYEAKKQGKDQFVFGYHYRDKEIDKESAG